MSAASPSPSPRDGATLVSGRYAILRKLGSGSMGTVYLAHDNDAGIPVALKVIQSGRLSEEAEARMRRELRAISALRHPQIAAPYDFGYLERSGGPYYTREYIEGSPLSPGPPERESPDRFLAPILDLLEALAYLHDHGVLHLDVHPGNLIVAEESKRGGVLIDFGFLRSLRGGRLRSPLGSWPVLPPELVAGGEPTPRSDLFFVGRLLHYGSRGTRTAPRGCRGRSRAGGRGSPWSSSASSSRPSSRTPTSGSDRPASSATCSRRRWEERASASSAGCPAT